MADACNRRAPSQREILSRLDQVIAELCTLRAALRDPGDEGLLFASLPRSSRSAEPIRAWIAERCDTSDAGAATRSSELYADFTTWCLGRRVGTICTMTAFGRALGDLCMTPRKDARGLRLRTGIRLRSDEAVRHA